MTALFSSDPTLIDTFIIGEDQLPSVDDNMLLTLNEQTDSVYGLFTYIYAAMRLPNFGGDDHTDKTPETIIWPIVQDMANTTASYDRPTMGYVNESVTANDIDWNQVFNELVSGFTKFSTSLDLILGPFDNLPIYISVEDMTLTRNDERSFMLRLIYQDMRKDQNSSSALNQWKLKQNLR